MYVYIKQNCRRKYKIIFGYIKFVFTVNVFISYLIGTIIDL